jgi:2,4-diketo-3-deoxy-L-fuconate hydrolase
VASGTLRLALVGGRSQFIVGTGVHDARAVDVERHTNGALPSDPMQCLARWSDVRAAWETVDAGAAVPVRLEDLSCPVPVPRQLFAIGLNYRQHVEEMGSQVPSQPLAFTKFPSSLNHPAGDIVLASDTVDYEAEVVLVVGDGGRDIPAADAWDRLAGVCVGQDVSDRALQYAGAPPQFSLGKSRRGFSVVGPWVADAASVPSRDDLQISCTVNGEQRQRSGTSSMVFPVEQIVSYLSSICELYPGDLIYTGSPPGVGHGMRPPRYLRAGDVVETTIDGVGTIRNRCR